MVGNRKKNVEGVYIKNAVSRKVKESKYLMIGFHFVIRSRKASIESKPAMAGEIPGRKIKSWAPGSVKKAVLRQNAGSISMPSFCTMNANKDAQIAKIIIVKNLKADMSDK